MVRGSSPGRDRGWDGGRQGRLAQVLLPSGTTPRAVACGLVRFVARSPLPRSPNRLLALGPCTADDQAMQVIAAAVPSSRADRRALARSAVVAILLLVTGVAVGWLCLGTQLVSRFMPSGRPDPVEMAAGVIVWGFAIVVPAAFLVLGVARLVAVLDGLATLQPRSVTPHLASALGPDHLAATDVVVPGGRRIHELVLGPFGIVVLGDVPPPSMSRHVGSRWEIKDGRGRWIPVEGPCERAARDAERVRGWLAAEDRDFTVRVYAAVVSEDRRLARTPSCAVVAPRDLAEWLVALPFQRGLTADRREHLVEMIRSVALPR
jgi:hypothetical protein